MILSGTIAVSRATAERIAAAAEEHGYNSGRQATLAVEAAARLYLADRGTSAVPRTVDERAAPVVTFNIAMSSRWFVLVADAALAHGLVLESQLRAILDASVASYVPTKPLAVSASAPVKRAKAVPRIPPFDPKYYAQHAAAFK